MTRVSPAQNAGPHHGTGTNYSGRGDTDRERARREHHYAATYFARLDEKHAASERRHATGTRVSHLEAELHAALRRIEALERAQ